jgi:arylsulfatase A-like enzyme
MGIGPFDSSAGGLLDSVFLRTATSILALALTLGACRPAPRPQAGPPTAVVLISVDTLRADRLNVYGYKERTVSPAIDALARDGILFENHIAAAPWTTPSHLSLLTSLHPSAHGVTGSFRDESRRLAEDRGFEKLSEATVTLAEALSARGFVTGAFTGGVTLDPKIGFGQGFATYDTSMYKLSKENTETMSAWVRAQGRGRFFLFWHNFEVHAPYLETHFLPEVLPPVKVRKVREVLSPLEERVLKGRAIGKGTADALDQMGLLTQPVCEALYVGGIRSEDRWVGRFLDLLRELGLYDRALIVLTSDHGEEIGERGPDRVYDQHGHTLYEELLHVPLIVKLPGQERAGTRVKAVTRAVDVMPTILDLVGHAEDVPAMQGTSLRATWEGSDPVRIAYAESLGIPAEAKALRTDRYKYVLSISAADVLAHGRRYIPPEPASRQLFDLEQDPGERVNLLDSERRAQVSVLADTMDDRLRRHVAAQRGQAEKVQLDPETLDKLKALGYVQ